MEYGPGPRLNDLVNALVGLLTASKSDLAEQADLSYSTLHAWATERRNPRFESAERIAALAEARAAEMTALADEIRGRHRADAVQSEPGVPTIERAVAMRERLAELRRRTREGVARSRELEARFTERRRALEEVG